jgi:hypothetical protein
MRKAMAALVLALAAGCGGRGDLKEFSSAEGRYRVLMYESPKRETKTAPNRIEYHVVGKEFRDAAVAVVYADLAVGDKETEAQIERRLEDHRKTAVDGVKGKQVSEKKLKLAGKYPGLESVAELDLGGGGKARLRLRYYLAGKRLYQLQAIGSQAYVDGPEAEKFFESFAIVP